MNILHLNENYEIKGGTEVYIHQLQDLLPLYSVNSFFLGVVSNNQESVYNVIDKTSSQNCKSESDLINYITHYIKENKIDLIHIHGISNPRLINCCLDMLPVIRSMHEPRIFCPGTQKFWVKTETICEKPFGLHCFLHAFTQRCVSVRPKKLLASYFNVKHELKEAAVRYKYILAMSDYMKGEAVLAGIDEKKIIVNPYFTPIINDYNSVDFSSERKPKRLLYIGRLHVSKGAHLLIQAMKRDLIKSEDIVIDIIGDGDFKSKLLDLMQKENIPSSKIVFHGWLAYTEIIQKIKESYLVVFPSIYPEAFGIVGIEAMMCAKPVVAFNVGGVPTWLQNNVTGFLVDVKNEKQFEEKINLLLHNKKMHHEFSINARKLAIENFSQNIHLKKLVSIYKKCL